MWPNGLLATSFWNQFRKHFENSCVFAGVNWNLFLASCKMWVNCNYFVDTLWGNILKDLFLRYWFLFLVNGTKKQVWNVVVWIIADRYIVVASLFGYGYCILLLFISLCLRCWLGFSWLRLTLYRLFFLWMCSIIALCGQLWGTILIWPNHDVFVILVLQLINWHISLLISSGTCKKRCCSLLTSNTLENKILLCTIF